MTIVHDEEVQGNELVEEEVQQEELALEDTQQEVVGEPATIEEEETSEQGYVPQTTYKVLDEEHEFDPWVKDYLSTSGLEEEKVKEVEASMRDIYTKAGGLEPLKKAKHELTTERDSYKAKFDELSGAFQNFESTLDKDLRQFMEMVDIPKEKVIELAAQYVQEDQLPYEQKVQLERQRQESQDLERLRLENESLRNDYSSTAVNAQVQTLDFVLDSPDYSEFGKAIPHFREQVIIAGNKMEQDGKRPHGSSDYDWTKMVTDSLVTQYKSAPMFSNQSAPPVDDSKQVLDTSGRKPTLPSSGRRQASPIKNEPKTQAEMDAVIAERLKELRKKS